MEKIVRQCPTCGSGELLFEVLLGQAHRLLTAPWQMKKWFPGKELYRKERFVCLQCGFVGEYLLQEDLVKLRENAAKHEGA